jgi:hypothetical protein
MSLSPREIAVETFAPMLQSLSEILDKGAAHGEAKGLDLANARLAPDMFPLSQQIQGACFHAQNGVSVLTGDGSIQPLPIAPDIAVMKAQIAATIAIVRSADDAAFAGAESRDCSIPLPGGNGKIVMDGRRFLLAWALPHFYFHLITAYDILRNQGVEIGKRDYLSQVGAFVQMG